MSYVIESLKLTEFINDSNIKLPRFQRKETWKDEQNFKICISIFKEFPVGVVIINEEDNDKWLLDGRQRRAALTKMRTNPIELYKWSRKFLKFKNNSTENDITKLFWDKIDEYLDSDKNSKGEVENAYGEIIADESQIYDAQAQNESSFNPKEQQAGLKNLLDMILMVHPLKNDSSEWEKMLDFSDYFTKLSYVKNINGEQKVDPIGLKSELYSVTKKFKENNKKIDDLDAFYAYFDEKYTFKPNQQTKFKKKISEYWDKIAKSLLIIQQFENVIDKSRIGVIRLTNASMLDAQNIFSLVNSGGTQLKAEELLSAKPYWNQQVKDVRSDVKTLVVNLYDKLKVNRDSNDDICRWDICATLLDRIDNHRIIFPHYDNDNETVVFEKITLGFKTMSALIVGGMSNKSVVDLEVANKADAWMDRMDVIVDNFNTVISIIENIDLFKYLKPWGKSVMELTSNAIALEFLTISYKKWEEKGKPLTDSSSMRELKREIATLFDRLVFEYATKVWRGSGDSKMANDIKNMQDRVKKVSSSDWNKLIKDACSGRINDQPVTTKLLAPLLYYYFALAKITPLDTSVDEYEIDHILPQSSFGNDIDISKKELKDSLINISLLPKKYNGSKNDKYLKDITDDYLKNEISRYTLIDTNDFINYSSINDIEKLKTKRESDYMNVFKTREDVLSQ